MSHRSGRYSGLIALILLGGLAGTAHAKSPKKSELTHIVCPAQYVYVKTTDGDIMRPEVLPEDRDAVKRVEEQLQEWKRYTLVYEPQNADLVFVVRTGRMVTERQGIGRGTMPPPGSGGGTMGPPGGIHSPNIDASNSDPGPGPGQGVGRGENGNWGTLGSDVGPPDDLLGIYTKPGNLNNQSALWMRTMKDGLDGPDVPLFQKVRKAVDDACKDYPKQ